MNKPNVGIELRALNNLIMRFMEKYCHKEEVENLTGTNSWIIGYIAENSDRDVFQRDLEREFSITRSTVSKVVALMEKKEFIRKESVSGDARLNKLVLTEKSIAIAALLKEDMDKLENQITKEFSQEELNQLISFIQRMKNNLIQ